MPPYRRIAPGMTALEIVDRYRHTEASSPMTNL
jgi:hypothetical protein